MIVHWSNIKIRNINSEFMECIILRLIYIKQIRIFNLYYQLVYNIAPSNQGCCYGNMFLYMDTRTHVFVMFLATLREPLRHLYRIYLILNYKNMFL